MHLTVVCACLRAALLQPRLDPALGAPTPTPDWAAINKGSQVARVVSTYYLLQRYAPASAAHIAPSVGVASPLSASVKGVHANGVLLCSTHVQQRGMEDWQGPGFVPSHVWFLLDIIAG
jgi:hypothetical protein